MNIIEHGDWVNDPLEEPLGSSLHRVEFVDYDRGVLHLDNGCIIGIDEPTIVCLPSEAER